MSDTSKSDRRLRAHRNAAGAAAAGHRGGSCESGCARTCSQRVPNTILTLLAIYFIYLILAGAALVLNGVWDAQPRSANAARSCEGHGAAVSRC
jgi:hypothetical protein